MPPSCSAIWVPNWSRPRHFVEWCGPPCHRLRGSPADLQRVRDALAQVYEPPRAVLRRMLAWESLAFDDMKAVLEGSGFAAEGHLVQLVLDVLKRTDLLQADDNQRWTLRPDVKDSVRRCPNPSVPQKFQSLAEQMRAWGRNADQRLRWERLATEV